MDDARVGRICRALRRRRRWRQLDLAARASVHQSTVSKLERGGLGGLRVDAVRRIFVALGAGFDGLVSWRAGDLDRLLDERHAAVVEHVLAIVRRHALEAFPEVTYAFRGERGSIDVLAVSRARDAAAVFEVKTDIPRVEEAIRRHDDKARLAREIVFDRFGFRPRHVAKVLVVPEASSIRRLVERHRQTFGAVYPATGPAVRRWLRRPDGPLAALWFLSPSATERDTRGHGGAKRVRVPKRRAPQA